jgi:glycosyltransferase involved in cell wall biosynthesis
MKICIISNQAFSLYNFRKELISDLKNKDHDIFVVVPEIGNDLKLKFELLGVSVLLAPISRSGINPLREIFTIFYLFLIFRRLRLDICLGIFLKPVAYSAIAAWFAGVKFRYGLIAGLGFAFGNSLDGKRRHLIRWFTSRVLKLATSRMSHVAFQNEDDYRQALVSGIVTQNNSTVIGGTGVDLDVWKQIQPKIEPVTFILVARMIEEKGIRDFVNAARLIHVKYSNCRFILLGGTDDNPTAISASEIDRWCNEGVVEWKGHVEVKPWLEVSSVFVLPSYYREGIPRSTQEAMAMGLPIITTSAPGCRETVIEGVNGFMVQPRNADTLAKAMSYFLDNPHKIASMGKCSRDIAETRFDIKLQNKKLMQIIGA